MTTSCNQFTMSILTWNVWFDCLELECRTELIMKEILYSQPHVVCFQEVVPYFATALSKNKKLNAMYTVSPYEPSLGYGNLTLVLTQYNPTFRIVSFPSKMGRKLLIADLTIGPTVPVLSVGNIHLESLDNQSARETQLGICHIELAGNDAILVGDFNIAGEDHLYRERQQQQQCENSSESPKDTIGFEPDEIGRLENDALAECLPGFVDVWSLQYPYIVAALLPQYTKNSSSGSNNNTSSINTDTPTSTIDSSALHLAADTYGYTFDEAVNNMSSKTRVQRKRIDRVLARLDTKHFDFVTLQRVGTSIFSTSEGGRVRTIFPSDHFGLLCTYLVHNISSRDGSSISNTKEI